MCGAWLPHYALCSRARRDSDPDGGLGYLGKLGYLKDALAQAGGERAKTSKLPRHNFLNEHSDAFPPNNAIFSLYSSKCRVEAAEAAAVGVGEEVALEVAAEILLRTASRLTQIRISPSTESRQSCFP